MSDHVNEPRVLLVGTGNMGREYAKVLKGMGVPFEAVGRSAESVEKFTALTGVPASAGGIDRWLTEHGQDHPRLAIVAVQAKLTPEAVLRMLPCGFDRILVEKPCGRTLEAVTAIADMADKTGTQVLVGYNRRFYSAVLAAEKIIAEDGGVQSFCFEITERGFDPDRQDVNAWFVGNDTHVIDLAFFLGGEPEKLYAIARNDCGEGQAKTRAAWAGCGTTRTGATFSYQGDWFAPGRWAVEVMTAAHRLIFRPMEKLQIQNIGSFAVGDVPIDDELDRAYKPGLYRETDAFLHRPGDPRFLTVQQQARRMPYYLQMLRGNTEK